MTEIVGLKFTRGIRLKGGEHSGHHDHAGRPGSVGGSAPSSSPGTIASWYHAPKIDEGDIEALNRFDIGDVTEAAKEFGWESEWSSYNKDVRRWAQGAEVDAKYDINGWIKNHPQVRALSLYNTWSSDHTKDAIAGKDYPSFQEWLNTPQILYRSGGRSDVFMSFARTREIALDATNATECWWIKTSPRFWLGTSAGEVWIASDAIETLGENF